MMPLLDELSDGTVDNIYIYVADAVRKDFLPDRIANLGVSIKAIAGSIISPTSFATIASGTYLPQHGVCNFTDKLPAKTPNILSSSAHETAFCNTINHRPFNSNPSSDSILTDTLSTTDSPSDILESISPPFLVMERGPGGHAPYGDYDGDATDYFKERGSTSKIQYGQEYGRSVSRDADWFLSQMDTLEQRGLLENTLVIYTSDHGELLGEMGMLGHNAPIHRRLVEVPCVWIHPELPNRTVDESIVRHIDLAPTVSSVTTEDVLETDRTPGVDLSTDSPPPFGASFYTQRAFTHNPRVPTISLKYESVWDAFGGCVKAHSSSFIRAIACVRALLKGPQSEFRRRHLISVLNNFLSGEKMPGIPKFSRSEAAEYLEQIHDLETVSTQSSELDVQEERLRELGYLE